MKNSGRALGALALLAVIFVLSRHTIGAPTTTTTTTSPGTTTSSLITTTTVTTTCHATDFSMAYHPGQGAAGTVSSVITMTYTSATPCVVSGYPIVTLQDRYGTVLSTTLLRSPLDRHVYFPDSRANTGPRTINVTLGTHVAVSFSINDVGDGTGACPTAVGVSVQMMPGDTAVPLVMSYPLTVCFHQVIESAVY